MKVAASAGSLEKGRLRGQAGTALSVRTGVTSWTNVERLRRLRSGRAARQGLCIACSSGVG
jgi:hypothetical protein